MPELNTNNNNLLRNICIGGIAIGTSYLAYQLYKKYFLVGGKEKKNLNDK